MIRLLRLFGARRRRLSVFGHVCAGVAGTVYHHTNVVPYRRDSL